jgi:hypothetical protein
VQRRPGDPGVAEVAEPTAVEEEVVDDGPAAKVTTLD